MPPELSSEAKTKLDTYHALLIKWQKAINLVSNNSLDRAWERHFDDSIQLEPYIPEGAQTLVDMGSGAGFPGLVLAVLRPGLAVHLIESDARKCEFLRTVSRETDTPVTVHNVRIEAMAAPVKPDIITARALAALAAICGYCLPFAQENPGLEMLLMKGEKAGAEIEEAQKKYSFDLVQFSSRTEKAGTILRLKNLRLA